MTTTPSVAFDRLHPAVQRWVWERGWTTLRDAQEEAVAPILAGDTDVIIAAATASGKTEAAFLPICSALRSSTPGPTAGGEQPAVGGQRGVQVLYVSPLKALINDQYERLELLCDRLEVPVHRWHGDVAGSRKARLLKAPDGVLLITPESLEAIFVVHGPKVARLLAGLHYVVVDELHAFLGNERGAQLQSLLHRVELAVRRRVPRIGLSATLGDMTVAAGFLRPGRGDRVRLIASSDDSQEIRLQLRGYLDNQPRPDVSRPHTGAPQPRPDVADASVTARPDTASRPDTAAGAAGVRGDDPADADGPQRAIGEHLFAVLRGTDNLVFANLRQQVEIFADLLARMSEVRRVPSEFWPHHGSLAKDLREHVETRLKDRSQPITVVCTSTLEMGIDIGSVTSIAQLGAPPSVSSLRQRLGRSGRRGEPAVLRVYVTEPEVTARSAPQDALRPELVQSIAMIRLLLDRWNEPPDAGGLHLSTLVQQVLSVIAQHGGATAADLHQALCGSGPFTHVDQGRFLTLLRSLGRVELLTQSSDGLLLLGATGERILNHYSFYAAFTTPEEYRLVSGGRTLGTLPIDQPLAAGTLLIFAGRRWRVLSVDDQQRIIDLTPAAGGRPPTFGGTGAPVHDRVRQEMRTIYGSSTIEPFLDAAARDLLTEARDNFVRYGLDQRLVIPHGSDALLFPWAGDRIHSTLVVALRAQGIETSHDGIAVTAIRTSPADLLAALRDLATRPPPDATTLASQILDQGQEKYDWTLDQPLLAESYAARNLDPAGAWEVIVQVMEQADR